MSKDTFLKLDTTSRIIALIGTLLTKTWRFEEKNSPTPDLFHDKNCGRIYPFWHAHLLPIASYFRHSHKHVIVSKSKDGRRAASIAEHWGHTIIEGSSSHGGMQALRESIEAIRKGACLAITPDGPRGPKCIVKPGAAQIALQTKAPIITISIIAKNAWRLSSWDRFLIPKPFSKVVIQFGNIIYPEEYLSSKDRLQNLISAIQTNLSYE